MGAGDGRHSESEWRRERQRWPGSGWKDGLTEMGGREARHKASLMNTEHACKAGNYGQLFQAETMKPIWRKQ